MILLSGPLIGEEEVAGVVDVLRSGQLAAGPRTERFELAFAQYTGSRHAIAVSSGTAALELSLRGLGVGPGDEVIVPSFTFIATANAVRLAGATPVFADVDAASYCLTADTVAPWITPRTVAVVAVHLYGNVADPDGLTALCRREKLALVEDAAQALGGAWGGSAVGTLGSAGAFSFYPTKNITTGEGGMVTTSDDSLAERVRLLRNHGSRVRYEHEVVGTNGRMTEMSAAIGLAQLDKLGGWQERRRQIAATYDEGLQGEYVTPIVRDGVTHAYHQYTIRCRDRDRVCRTLHSADIGYGIYYATPCHQQKPYIEYGSELPVTDELARTVLSVPVRPDLTDGEVDAVVGCLLGATGE